MPGICNEVGAGAAVDANTRSRQVCDHGTDCADCGARAFCTDCPVACQAEAISAFSTADSCLQGMWNDGKCDAACNTYACGHNDCREDEIISFCTLRQQDSPINSYPSTATSSRSLGKVYLGLKFAITEPLYVTVNTEERAIKARISMEYSMQWQDERLATSFCRQVLPNLLSVEQGSSPNTTREDLFWRPQLRLDNTESETITSSTFAFADNASWLVMPPDASAQQGNGAAIATGSAAPYCTDCASFVHRKGVELKFSESEWGLYHDYPFDLHTIRISAYVPNADILNCSEILSADSFANLEPGTKEWYVRGVPQIGHPLDSDGTTKRDRCEIVISLERALSVFMVKRMMINLLVAYSGFFSMYLHPQDNTGDRAALIIVAFLIIITNLQADLGLGDLTYLIWYDYFNLFIVTLLCATLIETMTVHRILFSGKVELALLIDAVCRTLTLYWLFPGVALGLILVGLGGDTVAIGTVMIVLIPLSSIVFGAGRVRYSLYQYRHTKNALVEKLRKAEPGTKAMQKACKEAFECFDSNQSGYMDFHEMLEFIEELHPVVAWRDIVSTAITIKSKLLADPNKIDVRDFSSCVEELTKGLSQFLDYKYDADDDSVSGSATRSRCRSFQSRRRQGASPESATTDTTVRRLRDSASRSSLFGKSSPNLPTGGSAKV